MWSGLRLGSFASEISLLIFIHHTRIWDCPFHCLSTPHCVSIPLCPSLCLCPSYPSGWMWLLCFLDFHTVQFSDGLGCYLLWDLVELFSVVVRGGVGRHATPTPTPTSVSIYTSMLTRSQQFIFSGWNLGLQNLVPIYLISLISFNIFASYSILHREVLPPFSEYRIFFQLFMFCISCSISL